MLDQKIRKATSAAEIYKKLRGTGKEVKENAL